jgi:hypothetical protein
MSKLAECLARIERHLEEGDRDFQTRMLAVAERPEERPIWWWVRLLVPFIMPFVGVFLGWKLATLSAEQTASYLHHQDFNHALRSVIAELDVDIEALNNDVSYLEQDLAQLDHGQRLLYPMNTLHSSSIQSAVLKGSFEGSLPDLPEAITWLYTATELLNQKIVFREQYVFSNSAMSNFTEGLKIFDQKLQGDLSKLRSVMIQERDALKQLITSKSEGHATLHLNRHRHKDD